MSAHLSSLTDVDFLYEAWKKVHVKKGSAGMDNINMDAFEADLDNQNVYLGYSSGFRRPSRLEAMR